VETPLSGKTFFLFLVSPSLLFIQGVKILLHCTAKDSDEPIQVTQLGLS